MKQFTVQYVYQIIYLKTGQMFYLCCEPSAMHDCLVRIGVQAWNESMGIEQCRTEMGFGFCVV